MQLSRMCRRARSTRRAACSPLQATAPSTRCNAPGSTCCVPSWHSHRAEEPKRPPLLLAAAQRLEPLNIELARETYLDAFSAALFGARLNGSVGVPEVAQAARAAPRRTDDEPTAADLLLDALVALDDDYEIAVPRCRDALQKLSGERDLAEGEAALVVAGLCCRPGDLGRRECVRLVAPQRSDRPEDGHAQRARTRAQRAHPGARVLRRTLRRRVGGRGNASGYRRPPGSARRRMGR